MTDTVKITINGKQYRAQKGKTILEVAHENGIEIPHYCYHPHLDNKGNCRMCQVEIESQSNPVVSCATEVKEDMVVYTHSDMAKKARAGNMEFLLINHPLDCPVCDQAGECMLQIYAQKHGTGKSRFKEEKTHFAKRYILGPDIILDQERCIKCMRCVKFLRNVTGTGELGYFKRGDRAYIDTFPGIELDNEYSINVADLCPVGALTDRNFRFKKRVWDLKPYPSVCNMCAKGCNINFWVNEDFTNSSKIWRITPRRNDEVNKSFICNTGRLQYREFEELDRLEKPKVKSAGVLKATGWKEAFETAGTEIQNILKGNSKVYFVTGRNTSNEELYLIREIARELNAGENIYIPEKKTWEGDEILRSEDHSANTRGVKEIINSSETLDPLKVNILVTFKMKDENIPVDKMSNLEFFLATDSVKRKHREKSDILLPANEYFEDEGTLVNKDGRVQRFRPALSSPGDSKKGWEILTGLADGLGIDNLKYSTAKAIFDSIAGDIKAFESLNYDKLGMSGAVLGEKDQ